MYMCIYVYVYTFIYMYKTKEEKYIYLYIERERERERERQRIYGQTRRIEEAIKRDGKRDAYSTIKLLWPLRGGTQRRVTVPFNSFVQPSLQTGLTVSSNRPSLRLAVVDVNHRFENHKNYLFLYKIIDCFIYIYIYIHICELFYLSGFVMIYIYIYE